MKLAATSEGELEKLYDGLARFQWWRRRLTGAVAGQELEMHKRLLAPSGEGPGAGTAAVNEWLWDRLKPAADLRALDIGCGFGASLFSLAEHAPAARLEGLSLSGYQVQVANREAARRSLGSRVQLYKQSFDSDLEPAAFDLVLSIETLFHSPDLARTLSNLAGALAPEGRLVLLEDMARDATVVDSEGARELLRLWSTRALHTQEDYTGGLERAGLRVIESLDLSAQVPFRSATKLADDSRRLRRTRGLLPTQGLRRMLDAFLGGLHLERLYADGRMSYRCLIASAEDD